ALVRAFGERELYDAFVSAEFGPAEGAEAHRQETNRWVEEWFVNSGYGLDDVPVDRLRSAGSVPLDLVGRLVPGAADALRWSKSRGLVVGLVTNTLWRGDDEVWEDLRRFGLDDAVDHVVSSHSVGWQKPHEAIFRRALDLSGVPAADAVMVGDRMVQDVWGAKRLGMRAIWRRPLAAAPQETVDVDTSAYDQGHVDRAVGLNSKTDLQQQPVRDLLDKKQLEGLLSKNRVTPSPTIVAYGDNNNWFAAWFFWLLKYYGHKDVKLVNGGRAKWIAEKRPLSNDTPSYSKSEYRAGTPDASIRALRDHVLEKVVSGNGT